MNVELEKVLEIFDEERQILQTEMNILSADNKSQGMVYLSLLDSWARLSVIRNRLVNDVNEKKEQNISKTDRVKCDESDL